MVVTPSNTQKLTFSENLNQQLMSYQISQKEVTISNHGVYKDEAIVANFLAELPSVLASLESLSENDDSSK
ncbi:MAG: hypothetical protein F6K54_19235 [Okeania sp. SIO3B5]|uniref:hypothetical protein n=1 Tax=Okeania sp. SIO3B5 TaxID=2607811 RepID=UPI0013FE986D|nr:hypothetical protein [Okeania sp. SIO3B5]NEO55020.1 hypothetical protein [Okeania sp. SIO3B5]